MTFNRQRLSNRHVTSHYLSQWRHDFCHYMVSPGLSELTCHGAKWLNRSGSTLAEVMAHFLMAPSYYLNQCSLIICEVLWPSTEGNRVSQEILKISILDMNLKINDLRLQPHLPCANDLRYFWPADQREAVQPWCLEIPCCEHTIWTISIIYHYGV